MLYALSVLAFWVLVFYFSAKLITWLPGAIRREIARHQERAALAAKLKATADAKAIALVDQWMAEDSDDGPRQPRVSEKDRQ